MGMNKNTVLGWATFIMVLMGLLLIGLGIFRYSDVSGWGFGAVGLGLHFACKSGDCARYQARSGYPPACRKYRSRRAVPLGL